MLPEEELQRSGETIYERNMTFTVVNGILVYFENNNDRDVPKILERIRGVIESEQIRVRNMYEIQFTGIDGPENLFVSIFDNRNKFKERMFLRLFAEE